MGHATPRTTKTAYANMLNTDDHAGVMAALGAMAATAKTRATNNVVPLARSSSSRTRLTDEFR
jgi:hypothetical protein